MAKPTLWPYHYESEYRELCRQSTRTPASPPDSWMELFIISAIRAGMHRVRMTVVHYDMPRAISFGVGISLGRPNLFDLLH